MIVALHGPRVTEFGDAHGCESIWTTEAAFDVGTLLPQRPSSDRDHDRITYGYLLGADVLVERVFSWNGVGLYSVQAITSADFAGLQAFRAFCHVVPPLLVYLLVDIINCTR